MRFVCGPAYRGSRTGLCFDLPELAPDIGVDILRLEAEGCNGESLDDQMWPAKNDLSVFEGPRFAFVGVEHDVTLGLRLLPHSTPLDVGGEPSTSTPCELGSGQFVDYPVGPLSRAVSSAS